MKRGHFAAAIIPALAAWAIALALTGGTAMAAASHRAPGHTAVQHTAVQHTADRRTAARAARHARAVAPPVVFDCSQGEVRPRSFILTCADGNDYLTMLSWSVWSATFASGTGTQTINDCAPNCTDGQFHSYPVDFVLWRSTPVPDALGQAVLLPGHGAVPGHAAAGLLARQAADRPGNLDRHPRQLALPAWIGP